MDRVLINPAIVSDIADAIREKGGTTEQIVVNQLGDAVRALPSGGGIADSTKELVNIVSGVTPTDELSLNNGIAKGAVDAPTEQSWEGERTTAGGGTIKDGIAYLEKVKGRSIKVNQQMQVTHFEGVGTGSYVDLLPKFSCKAGHKYAVCFSNKDNWNGWRLRQPFVSSVFSTTFGVLDVNVDSEGAYVHVSTNRGIAYSFDTGIFDLTEMGREDVTTMEQFLSIFGYSDFSQFPLQYISATIVVHSKHSAVVSKDATSTEIDTLSLPSLELRGVGTAQDEYTPSTGEVVRKMGVVDLGTLDWFAHSSKTSLFRAPVQGLRVMPLTTDKGNLICAKYNAQSGLDLWNGSKDGIALPCAGIYISGLIANDSAYSDVASFKAAMAGVLLWGELADPTPEQNAPQKAYYKAQSNGKEVAVAETLSAPFVAEIGYEEGTNAQVLNLL